MKNSLKKISINIVIILILSIIGSLALTILGKYVFREISNTQSFFQYVGYYSILVLIIQLAGGFWLIYLAINSLLKRHINIVVLSFSSGLLACGIVKIITSLGFETYYFEPFKHTYQIFSFFVVGFFYPYLSNYLNQKIYHSNT